MAVSYSFFFFYVLRAISIYDGNPMALQRKKNVITLLLQLIFNSRPFTLPTSTKAQDERLSSLLGVAVMSSSSVFWLCSCADYRLKGQRVISYLPR